MRSSSWEQLSEALQRVMATGVTERKAKRDICQAIANRKIGLRLYFMMRPTRMDYLTCRDIPTRLVHRVKGDDIPPILRPGDFDWPRSASGRQELWQNIRGPSGSSSEIGRSTRPRTTGKPMPLPDSQRRRPYP